MAHQLILEMDEFSPEIELLPANFGDIDRSHNSAQEVRGRLISPKPVLSPEALETPEFDQPSPREPPDTPLRPRQEYNHVQSYKARIGNLWIPGCRSQFPWRIILPLVICLVCLAASVATLIRSDGQPVAQWSVSPTVYLALLTTLLNMSLRYAFKEGVAISWWYKAVRGGTVKELHNYWSSGDGVWSAITAGRHFNLVSLGSIAATLIVIDQPLIQRASTVVSTPRTFPINVTAAIAPEIPWGYTGYHSDYPVMTQPMISAFNDYNTQVPITTAFSGCKDSCQGYIEAGGLAALCSTITGPVHYLQNFVFEVGQGPITDLLDTSSYLNADSPFNVNFTLIGEDDVNGTQIRMVVAYTNEPIGDCGGTRTQRTCSLRPATLRYPVTIQNGTLTLEDLTTDATVLSFQPTNNLTHGMVDGGTDNTWWTLGGLIMAAQSLFNANATYFWDVDLRIEQLLLADTLSHQFLETTSFGNSSDLTNLIDGVPKACNSSWTDPTNHILSALNQIAFRVSIGAATFPYRNTNDTPVPQVITMLETSNVNVFHSEYKYMIAMIILTTFLMGLVIPTFIGWWELGRHVTLDPIEIAKAFDAPMFQGPGSNMPLQQLVQDYGARNVRYGEPDGNDNGQCMERQLKLGDLHDLMRPTPGALYK